MAALRLVQPLRALALGAAALAWLAGTSAHANGRYPLADQIVIDPENPAHVVARTTFGLLDSDDAGQSFRWICETAIGYFGQEDPPIAVTADGSTVVASSKGISVSHDGGCSWIRNPGLTGTWFGVDVTVLPARPHEALALLSKFADGAYTTSIVRTADDGVTWEEIASTLGPSFVATTLEVAPSDPDRIYVSGKVFPEGSGVMWRSDDGGHSWAQFSLDLAGAYSIFIGAVDPQNPDVIYLRTSADDIGRVLVSTDGAMSFRQVWQAPGDVSGFALSPDGATVAVGGSIAGVVIASTADFAFRKTSSAGAYCLTFWGDRLLVCTKEAIDYFSIGVSDDLGEHFTPLLRLAEVSPRACEADASVRVCALEWSNVAMTIGADAGTPRAADAGDAGIGDVGGSGGCGCTLRARRADERVSLLLMGIAALLASARARDARTRGALRRPLQ
jgi:photosystem II stability/assembly factor-like uncharacterized protein